MGYSKGVDVSHHQGSDFNFFLAKELGYDFAILKASEGINGVDPLFEQNLKLAKQAGLIVGAYHYYHPELSPTLQAKNFLRQWFKLGDSCLAPIIDFETMPEGQMYLSAPELNDLHEFMLQLEASVEDTPIFYSGPSFVDEHLLNDPNLKGFPLWIAHYGVPKPRVPAPWVNWTFWQHGNKGMVGNHLVDVNFFNGTIKDLYAMLCSKTQPASMVVS